MATILRSFNEPGSKWVSCILRSETEEHFAALIMLRWAYKKSLNISYTSMRKQVRGKSYARSTSTMCSALTGGRAMTPDCVRSLVVGWGDGEEAAETCAQHLESLRSRGFPSSRMRR